MWTPAKACVSPVRGTFTPQGHLITRHLRTQCIRFYPRGFKRHDAAETSSNHGRMQLDQDTQTHTAVNDRHTDHRSIDTMDPVVLKYTNMVNELRSKSSGIERVNETHFGTIRFDTENVPHVHGQFDGEYGPDNTWKKEKNSRFHLQLDYTGGRTGVVKVREQELVENDSGAEEVQGSFSPPVEELKTGCEGARNSFNNYADGVSKGLSVTEHDATHESNYIESIFRNSNALQTADSLKPETVAHWDSAPSEHNHRISDNNIRDLNYVDEVFFKNSLENLEINRKPAINYSEIKKDLEDTLLHAEQQDTDQREVDGGKVGSQETRFIEPKSLKNEDNLLKNKIKKNSSATSSSEAPMSAFEYIVKKRQEEHKKQHGLSQTPGDGSNRSYKKILSLVSEKTKDKFTRYDVLKTLKTSILYNDRKYA